VAFVGVLVAQEGIDLEAAEGVVVAYDILH